ncbi:hypothetical protein TWF506_007255 [Arthrobotrys conoides]|uniref:RNA-dependent RNA polymerase n=1 Tax=Arthrobotrys conoides TaxID=74498 RepID=A0AAN8NX32_9PEZI
MDFTNLTLCTPFLLDSSQVWELEQSPEEPSFIGALPGDDESFSLLSESEANYASQESEFDFGGGSEFEEELCRLTEEIQSQRSISAEDSQPPLSNPEQPGLVARQHEAHERFEDQDEDAEGERIISHNSYNKGDDLIPTDPSNGRNISSSKLMLSWDCKSTEINFRNYKVSSQANYEITRTFQESENRDAVNRAVAAILRSGTDGCTLGGVIGQMKKYYFRETGKIVSCQPMEQFFNNAGFSADFDDQTQQAGHLEVTKNQGPGYFVRIKLKPLTREVYSHRFNREFGSRFLKLSRPRRFQGSLGVLELSNTLCDAVMQGVDILGRHWEVIHTSDASQTEKEAGMESSSVIMFAVSGDSIPTQTISQVVKWLIPPSQNQKMSTAKYNARIKLGFSRTALVTLNNVKIKEEEDIISTTGCPMTDGCGTATYAVLRAIAEKMALDYVPSYFQIRHGGRKGLIVLDPENRDPEMQNLLQIKYRGSQIKFQTREDLNIEVVDYARPLKKGNIGQQFISILHNGGVPEETLRNLAREAIETDEIWKLLEQADKPSFVKRFYQTTSLKKRRDKDGCFRYAGSMPISYEERIIQLVDAGFTISECLALKNLVSKCNKPRLESWGGLKFTISESTSVKCIPDFKGVLKEGEVFLQFSDGFAVGDTLLKFLCGKVLVGRAPAYIASDIQAATAVTSPEVLEVYRDFVDCIVFPTVGTHSFASYLSGGDYDGDSVLVIWDQRIVKPFISRLPPTPTSVREEFFKESGMQDTVQYHLENNGMNEESAIEAILRAEIPKMLSDTKVGICTDMHQKVSYHLTINNPLSIRLAELACLLLDAPKQGLILETEPWRKIEQEVNRFLKTRAKPFYMIEEMTYSKFRDETLALKRMHVLDSIKGAVLEMTEDYEKRFKAKFPDILTDHDISDFFSHELEYYRKATEDPSRSKNARAISEEVYEELLSFTKHRLEGIVGEWGRMYPGSGFKRFQQQSENDKEKDKANKEKLFAMFQEIQPNTRSGNPVLEDWARCADQPFGKWNLLKASALFRGCEGSKPMLLFTVAGPQLCYLKTTARGEPFRVVQEAVYLNMYTRSERINIETQGIDVAEGSEVKEGEIV